MIIVKVGEPYQSQLGDTWFDPTTKISKFNAGAANVSNTVTVWLPMQSTRFAPVNPLTGDVWINPSTTIPYMFDGYTWIPAVPTNYVFPPTNPTSGTIWIESLSQTTYTFYNGMWCNPLSISSVGSGGSNNTIWQPAPQIWQPITSTPAPAPPPVPSISTSGANSITTFSGNTGVNDITIMGPNNDMLVKIDTSTGIITYGPNYTPDAAAQIFWRAISGTSPRYMQTQIDTLVMDLKDLSSRLATAEGTVLKFHELGYKLPEPSKPFDPNDSWDRAMGIIK